MKFIISLTVFLSVLILGCGTGSLPTTDEDTGTGWYDAGSDSGTDSDSGYTKSAITWGCPICSNAPFKTRVLK